MAYISFAVGLVCASRARGAYSATPPGCMQFPFATLSYCIVLNRPPWGIFSNLFSPPPDSRKNSARTLIKIYIAL